MIKRGKKAQFYLVAAIIISLIVFGAVAVKNYSAKAPEETIVYDLEKELNFETGKVVDFSIYNERDINDMVENWTEIYVNGAQGKGVEEWIFVYGNKSSAVKISFNSTITGSVSLGGSGIITKRIEPAIADVNGEVEIRLGEFNYKFNLTENKNFIILIKRQGYIAKSGN